MAPCLAADDVRNAIGAGGWCTSPSQRAGAAGARAGSKPVHTKLYDRRCGCVVGCTPDRRKCRLAPAGGQVTTPLPKQLPKVEKAPVPAPLDLGGDAEDGEGGAFGSSRQATICRPRFGGALERLNSLQSPDSTAPPSPTPPSTTLARVPSAASSAVPSPFPTPGRPRQTSPGKGLLLDPLPGASAWGTTPRPGGALQAEGVAPLTQPTQTRTRSSPIMLPPMEDLGHHLHFAKEAGGSGGAVIPRGRRPNALLRVGSANDGSSTPSSIESASGSPSRCSVTSPVAVSASESPTVASASAALEQMLCGAGRDARSSPQLYGVTCTCAMPCWPYRSRCRMPPKFMLQRMRHSRSLPEPTEDSPDEAFDTPEGVPEGWAWATLERVFQASGRPDVTAQLHDCPVRRRSKEGAGDLFSGMGAACRRGQKACRGPNQDGLAVVCVGPWRLLVVVDGHGSAGHEVAAIAQRELLQEALVRLELGENEAALDATGEEEAGTWRDAIEAAFDVAQQQLFEGNRSAATLSGCTATVVLASARRVFAASAGDSSAVLGVKRPGRPEFSAVRLTQDHRPTDETEQSRIDAAGGYIEGDLDGDAGGGRLVGGRLQLAVSRGLGDFEARPFGFDHTPDFGPAGDTGVELDPAMDSFVLVCSDGVWDLFSPAEAVSFVARFGRQDAQKAAEALVFEAQKRSISRWGRGQADDTTAVVSWAPPAGTQRKSSSGALWEQPRQAWAK